MVIFITLFLNIVIIFTIIRLSLVLAIDKFNVVLYNYTLYRNVQFGYIATFFEYAQKGYD